MTKSFYIIVPYSPTGASAAKNAMSGFLGKNSTKANGSKDELFEEYRLQLEQRMGLVASGISATGVRAVALGTEEVIELLYRSFNPGELENPIRLDQ